MYRGWTTEGYRLKHHTQRRLEIEVEVNNGKRRIDNIKKDSADIGSCLCEARSRLRGQTAVEIVHPAPLSEAFQLKMEGKEEEDYIY